MDVGTPSLTILPLIYSVKLVKAFGTLKLTARSRGQQSRKLKQWWLRLTVIPRTARMLATLMVSSVLQNPNHAVSTQKANVGWGKADRHKTLRAHSMTCMTFVRLPLYYSLDVK